MDLTKLEESILKPKPLLGYLFFQLSHLSRLNSKNLILFINKKKKFERNLNFVKNILNQNKQVLNSIKTFLS